MVRGLQRISGCTDVCAGGCCTVEGDGILLHELAVLLGAFGTHRRLVWELCLLCRDRKGIEYFLVALELKIESLG